MNGGDPITTYSYELGHSKKRDNLIPPTKGNFLAYPMTDPWDWYIYLHEWMIFMVNVGKYTSPMDPMGIIPAILLITTPYHRKIMGVD